MFLIRKLYNVNIYTQTPGLITPFPPRPIRCTFPLFSSHLELEVSRTSSVCARYRFHFSQSLRFRVSEPYASKTVPCPQILFVLSQNNNNNIQLDFQGQANRPVLLPRNQYLALLLIQNPNLMTHLSIGKAPSALSIWNKHKEPISRFFLTWRHFRVMSRYKCADMQTHARTHTHAQPPKRPCSRYGRVGWEFRMLSCFFVRGR